MKLYDNNQAPNPRRVRMVLAEKGIPDVEIVPIELGAGGNLTPEFCAKNPFGKVPVLELDDGFCLAETGAICRYLDERFDGGSLFGKTVEDRARIDMWDHRMELGLVISVAMGFQHLSGFFKDRMTPVEAWGKECVGNVLKILPILEKQLSDNTWVAGSEFSIADITAICAIDFARVIKIRIGDEYPSIQRWHAAMKERPSYTA
ncbi:MULTISPECIES: glutathione S-transferase family protein [Thalassolituus]|jgi:glutathione S-transferase|uniref:glutathione S-transferase family protein n=1 Tax=Thalassolituus TaxID=187492 RepID=UPI000BC91DFE|nr:glutathione S-transferase family protein [Thalassolituus oleivorans]MBQ0781436.1 glutathione S-transferase family protein [Thalassolituus oleivorans]MDF1640093.1 glutathione S-transferase family protein [Thalassolituus oleivorans]PCI50656.1 MAG: glutathione S-transferase [Oceanospirillales bacterium]PHQ87931.1 MAG: glutathione S-transferase [Thalassobium sp.]